MELMTKTEKFASLPAMERERIHREAEAAARYAEAKASYEALEVDANRAVAQRFATNLLHSWSKMNYQTEADILSWDTAWYLIVVAEAKRLSSVAD
jgi:hypothetical protein